MIGAILLLGALACVIVAIVVFTSDDDDIDGAT